MAVAGFAGDRSIDTRDMPRLRRTISIPWLTDAVAIYQQPGLVLALHSGPGLPRAAWRPPSVSPFYGTDSESLRLTEMFSLESGPMQALLWLMWRIDAPNARM